VGRIVTIAIDVVVQSDLWRMQPAATGTVRHAITTAAASVHLRPAAAVEVSVVLASDAAVRKLNRDWRKIDAPTNVLAFPASTVFPGKFPARLRGRGGDELRGEGSAPAVVPLRSGQDPRKPSPGSIEIPPTLLGDIVLAYETAAREAATAGRPFAHHVAHLAVHGFLHLLGYDHDSDEDADEMERLEASVLARLKVSDPYLAPAHGA
jgi:probable rRNA maturation factor